MWNQSKVGRCMFQGLMPSPYLYTSKDILAFKSYPKTMGLKNTKNEASFYEEIV